MMRISRKSIFLLGLSVFLLAGCMEQSYETSKKNRMQIASESKDGSPVIIGVAWKSAKSDLFLNGVKLAVKEINQKGGIFGGELQIIIDDSESAFNNSTLSASERNDVVYKIANSFAANQNLIAVVGHSSSSTSLLASVIYQNNGILFLAPNAKYSKLTGHNFDYIFRTASSNMETGIQLADYVAQQGYKNIAVLHNREDSSTELTNVFVAHSVGGYSADIFYRSSFFESTRDITSMVVDLKNIRNLDAIFISASSETSAKIYQQMRKMDISLPVIGGDTLDSRVFSDQVKEWEKSDNVKKSTIPTLFDRMTPNGQEFVKRYNAEYGEKVKPDYLAALGYDTINVLVHAIQLAQSTIPIEIATTLRYMKACKGAAGKYEFKPNGDLKAKRFYFKRWDKDHYNYEVLKDVSPTNEVDMDTCNDIDKDLDSIPDIIDDCPNTSNEEKTKGITTKGTGKGCVSNNNNPKSTEDNSAP
jgi:branched-chain amino acid transport system substrate-binding protein